MRHHLNVNDTLGDYRITGRLGEGGMGVVYRGVHEKLGRETAIKVLSSASYSDPSFKSRFLNEARLQAGLHHPNVATLYDFREYNDELVIFMELVDGDALDDLVDRRAFAIDEALTVFASICDAVAYIHDNGIVHRDIKAQNAKLTLAGTVKLLDFGIAKDSSSQGLTQTGGIIGTPNYLSPEQLQGSQATPQSDIWALGVLLYEMLTGHLPFRAESFGSLVVKITAANYTPVDGVNPAVSRNIASVVAKCLKKDVRSRYTTARDLLLDVRAALNARHASVAPQDLRTAVIRAREKPRMSQTPTVETAPSSVLLTSVTHRTRVRRFVIAISGGAILLISVLVSLYLFVASGDTPAQAGSEKPVKIDLFEGKATVIRDGQSIGVTPLEISVKKGETISLKLRRDGYEDRDIKLTGDEKTRTFRLTKKE